MKIALLSCVKKKTDGEAKAKDLYISPLFKGAYRYAKSLQVDRIYILSAKYGLLDENQIIRNYDETLNGKTAEHIKSWTNNVIEQLKKQCDIANDEFIILAGNNYRKYLVKRLNNYIVPLKGKRQGEQLHFYTELGFIDKENN